jgi:hypothetical protein
VIFFLHFLVFIFFVSVSIGCTFVLLTTKICSRPHDYKSILEIKATFILLNENFRCECLSLFCLKCFTHSLPFFTLNGFPCPPLSSLSDHFLRTINKDFDEVLL